MYRGVPNGCLVRLSVLVHLKLVLQTSRVRRVLALSPLSAKSSNTAGDEELGTILFQHGQVPKDVQPGHSDFMSSLSRNIRIYSKERLYSRAYLSISAKYSEKLQKLFNSRKLSRPRSQSSLCSPSRQVNGSCLQPEVRQARSDCSIPAENTFSSRNMR